MVCELGKQFKHFTFPQHVQPLKWRDDRLERHADIIAQSFMYDFDGQLFPNLANFEGSFALMCQVAALPGFCPAACLLAKWNQRTVGAIQAVFIGRRMCLIQNLGVVPQARGQGVGRALLLGCLGALSHAGGHTCQLEVTAKNTPAVQLYQSVGFVFTHVRYLTIGGQPTSTPFEQL